VMELLHGESLRERLARPEPLALRSALHLLRDAARGVAVGHDNGLVHRDLKPANLFLETAGGAEPHVRILDFGIAKLLDEDDEEETRTHLTLPGEWFGSEFYSPPEHLRREAVTRASDVYSLGVVAFELLTRTRLFTRDDMVRRRQGLPVPIPSIVARNPGVPREVEVIVRRALAEDPALRYEDAGMLATELHRALSRLRRHADVPVEATAAVPEEATLLATAGDADGATVLAGVQLPGGGRGLRRRGSDSAPDPLDAELERVRMRKLRRRALQVATAAAMGVGVVAGGYGIAAMRAEGPPASVAAPPRTLNAAEENEDGLRKFRRGAYGTALEAFSRAKQKAPSNAEYANNHAYALLRAGRAEEAVTALSDVVAQYPQRQVAYSNLAEAQLVHGDTAGAVASLQALLALDPSPARRREAETFLDRLDAGRSDMAEWEEVQEGPADLTDPSTWDEWMDERGVIATDTVVAEDGGYTVSDRLGSEGRGVIRRRTWSREHGWRDTLVFQLSPRDTLRVGMQR